MSDNITDIVKIYRRDVLPDYPRHSGLSPIPEYSEREAVDGMWSAALDTLLTTLRYLAPATFLTLFWGQQSLLFRILKYIDLAIRPVIFPRDQRESVLKWLAEAGSVRVEHLDTVWRHGWILCNVLEAALPGACPGHPPVRQTLKHAQTIADHYLHVEPVFSDEELESNDCLNQQQERILAEYLERIREALTNTSHPIFKPSSQITAPMDSTQITFDYAARGAGLTAAQVNNKAFFKIYPTAQQSLDPGEINILIRGPKDTYGMITIPSILGKAQQMRQRLMNLHKMPSFTDKALPLTHGATYLRAYGRNDMNKTYHIPKMKYEIDIDVENHEDYSKISYVPKMKGKYEISIVSKGQSIVGSPFNVTASHNILGALEKDSFNLEDGEEIDILDIETDKKVVIRIVDFVTEKMLLRDNGTLEKISDEEANALMATENVEKKTKLNKKFDNKTVLHPIKDKNEMKFNELSSKILKLNKVCNAFNDLSKQRNPKRKYVTKTAENDNRGGIPDVVNSTFSDAHLHPFETKHHTKDYIKFGDTPSSMVKDNVKRFTDSEVKDCNKYSVSSSSLNKSQSLDMVKCSEISSNPFFEDSYQNLSDPRYINHPIDEYDMPIKIMIEEDKTSLNVSPCVNPFIQTEVVERPKTPILKIISGELFDRKDSLYVDSETHKITEDILRSNEFINPFYKHNHHESIEDEDNDPKADFKIGAPVSLPPILRSITPEPMDSLMMTEIDKNFQKENEKENQSSISDESLFYTIKSNVITNESNTISPFHSLDSIPECNEESVINNNERNLNQCEIQVLNTKRDHGTSQKDMWDSAYVSIDENNSCPDTNNNDNESVSKSKFSLSDGTLVKKGELLKMGPAEIELWTSCIDLNNILPKINDDVKSFKGETKRSTFTPIQEENDKKENTGINTEKLIQHLGDTDPVAVAFAELNDVFQEYASNSESNSLITNYDDKIFHNSELEYPINDKDVMVKSASVKTADVMRPTIELYGGTISEVQQNAAESVSVSHYLQNNSNSNEIETSEYKLLSLTEFGQTLKSNIVAEKKKYWDDRIRQIEEKKSEETKMKSLISKNLQCKESLRKGKAKQIAKNLKKNNDETCDFSHESVRDIRKFKTSFEQDYADPKLVDKWKTYWDGVLETEKNETEVASHRAKSPKSLEHKPWSSSKEIPKTEDFNDSSYILQGHGTASVQVKQELSEEVYRAFEESPKRFFGTSRKQIWNKIDYFSAKPSSSVVSLTEMNSASHEKGIVSSRINQFHNIANVESSLYKKGKSNSMHNILYKPDYDKKRLLSLTAYSTTDIQTETESDKSDSTIDLLNANEKLKISSDAKKNNQLVTEETCLSNTFDKSATTKSVLIVAPTNQEENYSKGTIKDINLQSGKQNLFSNRQNLQKSSISKSEMDIFNKLNVATIEDNLEIRKSYEELPKVNVKNFINMYEKVSNNAKSVPSLKMTKSYLINSNSSHQGTENDKSFSINTAEYKYVKLEKNTHSNTFKPIVPPRRKRWTKKASKSMQDLNDSTDSLDNVNNRNDASQEKEQVICTSLSDRDILKSMPEEKDQIDYKSRFKLAKQYFQSIEEQKHNTSEKLNECEVLLYSNSKESPDISQKRKLKKGIKKSHSLPSSELSEHWKEYNIENDHKLVKISEKFNVDDLFNDVMDGKLSRRGSLRGIPHKKAVLETFKSMENVAVGTMSSYEIAVSQLTEFAKENKIKNAQTYLTEYPYLPTTDPSKYNSRLDAKASGLITMKELLENKPRRKSVPDLMVNSSFVVEM